MRLVWGAFAFGVLVLQRQAALPGAATWASIVTALLLALGAALWVQRHEMLSLRRVVVPAVLACVAGSAGFGYAAWRAECRLRYALPVQWEGREIVVTGAVHGLPARNPEGVRFVFEVDTNDAGIVRFPRTIQLSWLTRGEVLPPTLAPGDRWRLPVRLKRPHGNANFGVRDLEPSWLERNIRALGYVSTSLRTQRLPGISPTWGTHIDRVRAALRERIFAVLPAAAHRGIVVALAVGAQDDLTVRDRQILQRTGTSHLVAISGLHVSIVGGLCAWFAGSIWRRSASWGYHWPLVVAAPKIAVLGAVLGGVGYALLAGFNVPAQRASWMLALAGGAYVSGRSLAPSVVFAWALGGVLLRDPWAVTAPGFWLSFTAVAAILGAVSGRFALPAQSLRFDLASHEATWAMRARRWAARGWVRLYRAARTQYAVTIVLAPLTALWFAQIPLSGPLANAFAIPSMSLLITPLALMGGVLPAPLDALAYRAAHGLIELLMRGLVVLGKVEGSIWWLLQPSPGTLCAALVGAAWCLMPRGWPLRWAAPLAWLPLLAPAGNVPPPGGFRLTTLDVGQGASVLIETARHTLLYDAGPGVESTHAGERIVVPFLRAQGVTTLDTLMVSHADADHAGGADAIFAAFTVHQLIGGILPAHPLWRVARSAGTRDAVPCAAGQRWRWDGVEFSLLWPAGGPRQGPSNAQSCVLRIAAGGMVALLTGDIGARDERALIANNRGALAAQVLMVPHHGSRSSSTEPFLDAIDPNIAIFQTGYRNRFRHPHRTVWARYIERGIALPRTDRDGAVRIDVTSDALRLEYYRDTHRRYWMGR